MKATFRRVAEITSAALAASALTLPVAQPAHAATPTEKLFVIEDLDGDHFAGLYSRPTPSGGRTAVLNDNGRRHVYNLSSSADGSRITYVQINYSTTTGRATTQEIVVRDASTRGVRVLDTEPYSGRFFLGSP